MTQPVIQPGNPEGLAKLVIRATEGHEDSGKIAVLFSFKLHRGTEKKLISQPDAVRPSLGTVLQLPHPCTQVSAKRFIARCVLYAIPSYFILFYYFLR